MEDKSFKQNPIAGAISRRDLMLRGVSLAAVGSAGLPLVACGGGGTAAAVIAPVAAAIDPIWGAGGAADKIVASLAYLKQSYFPATDFSVVTYGAQSVTTAAVTSPYVTPLVNPTSLLSTGADFSPVAGSFDSRPAFLAAIAACNAAGGGRVVVPAGNWYCAGPIVLLSNVNFHLSSNCTIYFSPDPADYAKDGPFACGVNGHLYYSRWQGNDCLNFGSPIYAYKAKKIAITGEGPTSILNGQAMTPFVGSFATPAPTSASPCWWTWKGSTTAANSSTPGTYGFATGLASQATANTSNPDLATLGAVLAPNIFTNGATNSLYLLLQPAASTVYQQDQNYLPALSEAGVPPTSRIFGLGHQLRPPLVQFVSCTQVLMEGYQAQCSPFWVHHPVASTDVVIRSVKADSAGHNNDGFDPDACTNVLCDGMTFNTGDDCIAIKSAKNLDTFYGTANNHVIQNCIMNTGHGGITMGSEMGAGVEKIYARNLQMLNLNWATSPLNIAIRIKTNMNRGGSVKDIYIDNVSLPNGVNLVGKFDNKSVLPSPINNTVTLGVAGAAAGQPTQSQGGVITFDCDYSPSSDAVRTRPPVVNNIQISNVTVGNVTTTGTGGSTPFGTLTTGTVASCFQAVVLQGPVKTDYNGPLPAPTVFPITNVSITNCDFGNPVCPAAPALSTSPSAIYAWNVSNVALSNVKISGAKVNQVLNDVR